MKCDLLKFVLTIVLLAVALPPGTVHADIDIGGLIFDDLAFADRIMSTDYTGLLAGCPGQEPTDLEAALLGADLNTWIDYGAHDYFPGDDGDFESDAPPTQYFEISFMDNQAVNLPGPDIAIFQIGGPNAVRVALDLDSILNPGSVISSELVVTTASLGIVNNCNEPVNVGYLELDDFGIAAGETVYHLFLSSPLGVNGEICGPPTGYANLGVPELAAVGAINSGTKDNEAPLVFELTDQFASQPEMSLPVSVEARDDGLPLPSALNCSWASVRGPATATFDDPNAFETTANFPVTGRYTLAAEVSDGDLITTVQKSVMVTAPDSQPPAVPDSVDAVALSATTVRLSWREATDNVDVAGYEIYRDGGLVATTENLVYSDNGLEMLTGYTYQVAAVDISGNVSLPSTPVAVSTLGFVIEVLPSSNTDDAEEEADGTMVLGSNDLDLGVNGASGAQMVGLRYASVAVPQYALVRNAWIEFNADAANAEATSLLISAEASGDAAAFSTTPFDLSSRLPVSGQVPWDNLAEWQAEHYNHRSPDISVLVQELVSRPDWAAGHAMAFLVTGSGARRAKAYEAGWLVCPTLYIEYELAPPVNQAPMVDAGPDGITGFPDATLALAGSVTDDGLPEGQSLSILWALESGPGLVTFADRRQADTEVTFYRTGVYLLRLTVDDGEYTVFDTVTVTVNEPDFEPPSIPANLSALAMSGSRVDLSWDPSTDNQGVNGYVIHRDGVLVGSSTVTSWSDTGLQPLTVYQYSVEAIDHSGNLSGAGDVVFVVTLEESYMVSIPVAANEDDAEEGDDGSIQLYSSDLELVEDAGAGVQTVGLRFDAVDIPAGAWITGAWIEFEADETNSDPASLTINAEESGDPAPFSSTAFDITSRPTLAAGVAWDDIPAWDTVDERHLTPDLAVLVQQLVDRGDWLSGNAMAIIITGSGVRTAESREGEQAAAPVLHVEYTPGVSVNTAPWTYAGADMVTDLTRLPLQLTGVVFDDGLPFDTLTVTWTQESGPGTAWFSDAGLADSEVDFDLPGTYVLQLAADDGEYVTTDTISVTVTELDLVPPTIPQNLDAQAIAGSRVDLSWEASSDNVSVAGYLIYRDGEPYWRTTGTSWSDTDPGPASRHDYTVEAYDPAGNFSGQGDPVTVFVHPTIVVLSSENR